MLYLYFDGSCAPKPKYENPLCYLLSIKVTPLESGVLPRYVVDVIASFMTENQTYAEVFIKEAESDDNMVDYFIINGLTNDVTSAWVALSLFDNQSINFGGNWRTRVELVSFDISYFNGQYIVEVPSTHFENNHDNLIKLEQRAPGNASNDCINKTLVFTNKLLKCPFIQLKLAELSMDIANRYLFFPDSNTTSLSWLEYKKVNDSIFICLSDYKHVYAQLPEMTIRKIETPKFLTEISLKNLTSLLCVCLSIGCLLITTVILIVTPDFHTQPGFNTLVLCICLLLAQTVYQFGVGQTYLSRWLCSMTGALSHFSWLCVMFAMNVCSLDMFLVFRKLKLTRFDSPGRKVLQRVVFILAFSLFFLMVNIVVSLTKSRGDDMGYGGSICYISSGSMQIVTFIAPSVLIILINITLFMYVVFKISKNSIRTAGLNQERNYFGIYARLSTLTGFTWIVGFLLLLIQNVVLEYLFILLNASQGLFIMIAFVFNRRLLNQCWGRLSALRSTRTSK